MDVTYTVERVEDVPSDATVRDYDELGDAAKAALPRMLAGDDVTEVAGACGLTGADVINYTRYYRVERSG